VLADHAWTKGRAFCRSNCLVMGVFGLMETAVIPPLTSYPSDLLADAASGLIVFDGVCVLCNGFVQFVLRHDKAAHFKFLTAQSDRGEALYAQLGLKHGDYDTNLVFLDGQLFQNLDAFLAVMDRLGRPWRAAMPLKHLPLPVKDWLYNRVARNRYQLFGKRARCMVPDASVRARFLD
jgi:predicted DCC family thiol-disulfide oxidoreductase YuxK